MQELSELAHGNQKASVQHSPDRVHKDGARPRTQVCSKLALVVLMPRNILNIEPGSCLNLYPQCSAQGLATWSLHCPGLALSRLRHVCP